MCTDAAKLPAAPWRAKCVCLGSSRIAIALSRPCCAAPLRSPIHSACGRAHAGLAAYAPGIIPYTATFFIFTDYMRASMRVAALSELRHIFVMTHDSIGLGEDGPTHQPVEHLASFRAMPNIYMMRPCGGTETAGAYKFAVEKKDAPTVLALSRQGMPDYDSLSVDKVAKGAYVVSCEGSPTHILIGTGTELQLCMEAAEKLKADGVKVRATRYPRCTCSRYDCSHMQSYAILGGNLARALGSERTCKRAQAPFLFIRHMCTSAGLHRAVGSGSSHTQSHHAGSRGVHAVLRAL